MLGDTVRILWRVFCILIWLGAVVALLTADNALTAIQAGFVAVMTLYVIARRSE
jgi:hypothetical protein